MQLHVVKQATALFLETVKKFNIPNRFVSLHVIEVYIIRSSNSITKYS